MVDITRFSPTLSLLAIVKTNIACIFVLSEFQKLLYCIFENFFGTFVIFLLLNNLSPLCSLCETPIALQMNIEGRQDLNILNNDDVLISVGHAWASKCVSCRWSAYASMHCRWKCPCAWNFRTHGQYKFSSSKMMLTTRKVKPVWQVLFRDCSLP